MNFITKRGTKSPKIVSENDVPSSHKKSAFNYLKPGKTSKISTKPENLIIESRQQEIGGKNVREQQRKIGIVPSPGTAQCLIWPNKFQWI